VHGLHPGTLTKKLFTYVLFNQESCQQLIPQVSNDTMMNNELETNSRCLIEGTIIFKYKRKAQF
jgi:hypothetical protein